MKLTFRVKLLVGYVALVAVAELLTVAALDRSLTAELTEQLSRRLEDQARGSVEWVSQGRHPDVVAGRLSKVVAARVTVLDARGFVAGDSDAAAQELAQRRGLADDTGKAPEVAAARTGVTGRATRFSEQLGADVLYVAVPAPEGYVVRLAAPLTDVTSTITLLRERLLLASAVVFALAVALSFVVARVLARPLVAMRDLARGIAKGIVDDPSGAHLRARALDGGATDELDDLGRSLRLLSEQLDARLHEIVSERDRLQAVLAAMKEGVVVVGADRNVELANPAASTLLGRGALAAHPALAALIAAAQKKGASESVELDEGGRSLVATVQPLHDGGAVAVVHDVTATRRMEDMRRRFVGDVSHEIGTPVAAILGYADTLLAKTPDPATAKEFLEIIQRHAKRIGRLVEDLRFLSSLEARGPEARSTEARDAVNVRELARFVEETVRARALAKRVTIELDDVDEDAVVLGDADHVERVLLNLVENAVKYGKDGGRVTVRAKKRASTVVVDVEDDGPGIGPEHHARIFDRFYRVDRGRSRDQGGTGLGLAIVKQLVEAMGGTASVASEPGKGARFVVELPVAPV